MSQKLEINFHI